MLSTYLFLEFHLAKNSNYNRKQILMSLKYDMWHLNCTLLLNLFSFSSFLLIFSMVPLWKDSKLNLLNCNEVCHWMNGCKEGEVSELSWFQFHYYFMLQWTNRITTAICGEFRKYTFCTVNSYVKSGLVVNYKSGRCGK